MKISDDQKDKKRLCGPHPFDTSSEYSSKRFYDLRVFLARQLSDTYNKFMNSPQKELPESLDKNEFKKTDLTIALVLLSYLGKIKVICD